MTLPAAVRALEKPSSAALEEVLGRLGAEIAAEVETAALPLADAASGEALTVTQPIAVGLAMRKLLFIVRAGSLTERREASRRLGLALAGKIDSGDVSRREIAVGLASCWDPEIVYETAHALRHASGAVGRDATSTASRTQLLMVDLERRIERYWNGEEVVDPILALLPEERTLVGVFCRDLPDLIVAHLSELLVRLVAVGAHAPLREVTFALIPAADARLIPSLVRVLEDGPPSVRLAAARALGRVDDPRCPAALARALGRETDSEVRNAIGGSLALCGDRQAADELRASLASHEHIVAEAALEGLAAAGSDRDIPAILTKLDVAEPALAIAAAGALGRVGDASALSALHATLQTAELPALRAALLGAIDRVRARVELEGGREALARIAPPMDRSLKLRTRPIGGLVVADQERTSRPSPWARLRAATRDYFGRIFFALGFDGAAARQFTRAAELNPISAPTLLRRARAQWRRGELVEALPAFRAALARDPVAVQRRGGVLADLLRAYLQETTRLEDASHRTEARQTLDELLALDLSMAPLPLRLEVARRREVLRRT